MTATAAVHFREANATLSAFLRGDGAVDALDSAIEIFGLLVREPSLAADSPLRAAALTNMSVALRARYRTRSAQPSDLNESVTAASEAVDLTQSGDKWRASRVNNLGAALRDRYQETGRIADLAEAVARQRELIRSPFLPPSQLPMLTNNTAQGLRELYEVTAERRYLTLAAQQHRAAIALLPTAPLDDVPKILSNAGITARLAKTSEEGAREAIGLQTEALRLTSAGHPELAGRVLSLAWSWGALASNSQGEDALLAYAKGERMFDEAIHLMAASPELAGALSGRAALKERRWRLTQRPSDLEDAIRDYSAALDVAERRSPITGLGVALAGGVLAASKGDHSFALEILRKGLRLLDDLLPLQALRVEQRAWHRHAEDLIAVSAVVIATEEGAAPAAAIVRDYYRREANVLEASARLAMAGDESGNELRRHLVEWIHGDTGEGRAVNAPLAGGSVYGLFRAAEPEGDIATMVFIVASDIGGVLIVTEGGRSARCRLLPKVGRRDVQRRAQALERARRRVDRNPAALDRLLDQIASWTYSQIALPLMEMVPDGEAVCIVACGSLAQLPLVAAVRVEQGSTDYPMLSRPVRHLSRRSARWEPRHLKHGVVVLGDLDPASLVPSPLAGAVRRLGLAEAEGLGLVSETRTVERSGASASVIGDLAGSDILHFACHGVSHPTDAASSRILLGGDRSLTVGDLLQAPLASGPLVFLASCETGRPDPTLPDQTFGLVEGLLYAGARAVIAPDGPISRLTSVTVSARVYDGMRLGGTPDEALADAQRWLVAATDTQIRTWLERSTSTLKGLARPHSSLAWLAGFFTGQGNVPSRALRRSEVMSFSIWT